MTGEMTRLLDTFKMALEARDFDTLETLLAEDFRYQEPGMPLLSKAGLLEREKRGAASGPVSTVEYDILSAGEENGVLWSDIRMAFETRLPKAGEVIVFKGFITQEVTAIRTDYGLQFRSVDVRDQQIFRNGEPAGAEAIEEMHRGNHPSQ